MAVQKSKVTRSRRGQRRSHDALNSKTLSIDPVSGEKHLRRMVRWHRRELQHGAAASAPAVAHGTQWC